jgi:TolB-like protein/Flp pilus assembly protein TadD
VRFVGGVREEADVAGAPAATVAAGARADDGPAIAVLPFTNMSGDSESDYFADGMAEEIITSLSRCGGILVIARNSSFTYKGRAVDVRQVGRELGVGYVLEGSVRRAGDTLRITAQLIETGAGTHVWADRFDGSLRDAFALQDKIADTAAAIIEPRLRFAEVERARRSPPKNLRAYDLWLQAVSHYGTFTADGMVAALKCLEQALSLDPLYAPAMATIAFYHAEARFQGWAQQSEDDRRKAVALGLEAVELARDDPNLLWLVAFAVWALNADAERSRDLFERALRLNPNSAQALTRAAWVEAITADPVSARAKIERAFRLDPIHPRDWAMHAGMAMTYLAERRFADAVPWAENAVARNPRAAYAQRALAVALVNAGDLARARQVFAAARAIEPNLSATQLRARIPVVRSGIRDIYIEALRQVGLPD